MSDLLETLAALEHHQWMQWATSILNTEDISQERRDRWGKCIVPYHSLSDEMQEHDRVWARKVLEIIEPELKERDARIAELEETHRMQLAGISTISVCNTKESLRDCYITSDNPYWTPAFEDVVYAMDREIENLETIATLREALESVFRNVGFICEKHSVLDGEYMESCKYCQTEKKARTALDKYKEHES